MLDGSEMLRNVCEWTFLKERERKRPPLCYQIILCIWRLNPLQKWHFKLHKIRSREKMHPLHKLLLKKLRMYVLKCAEWQRQTYYPSKAPRDRNLSHRMRVIRNFSCMSLSEMNGSHTTQNCSRALCCSHSLQWGSYRRTSQSVVPWKSSLAAKGSIWMLLSAKHLW